MSTDTKFNLQQALNSRGFFISNEESSSKVNIEPIKFSSKVLDGINGLSIVEFDDWKQKQLDAGKIDENTSDAYLDRLYRNQQYAAKYGIESFKSLTPAERDIKFKEDYINESLLNAYGSDPRFQEILELSDENKIKLLESNYFNPNTEEVKKQQRYYDSEVSHNEEVQSLMSELQELEDLYSESSKRLASNIEESTLDNESAKIQLKTEEKYNESLKTKIEDITKEINKLVANGADISQYEKELQSKKPTLLESAANIQSFGTKGIYGVRHDQAELMKEGFYRTLSNNQKFLDNLIEEDNNQLAETLKPESDVIKNKLIDSYNNQSLSYDEISNMFEEAMAYSNHYQAFKDAHELKNLSLEDKIEFIATNQAILNHKDSFKALSTTDQLMRNYVSDNQSGWDWAWGTTKNIGVGGVAHMANKGMAFISLVKALQSIDGSDELTNFLQGLDANGNKLDSWINPQYWNGVDKFNTFSAAEINKAEQLGGVSRFNNITRAGEEFDFWSWNTLNEGLKMSKYIWSTALMSYIDMGAANGLSKLARVAGASTKALSALNTVSKFYNKMAAAAPMSFNMGINTFNETLQTLNENITNKIDEEVNQAIRNVSPEVISSLIDRHLNSLEVQEQIDNQIASIKKSYKGEKGLQLSDKSLKEQYLNDLRKELEKNPYELVNKYLGNTIRSKVEARHSNNRDLAKEAATKAYMTQATISQIKETLEFSTFRKWMLAPSARNSITGDVIKRIVKNTSTGLLMAKELIRPEHLWRYGKHFVGEAGDEGFDGVSEGFSQGFGLGYFNNITGGRYNPEAYIYSQNFLGNMLSGINEAMSGAKDKLTDEGTIYEALIGAISPFNINPNIGGILTKKPDNWNELSWQEKVSKYVSNALLNEAAEIQRENRELNEMVSARNKVITDNKETLLNIATAITRENKLEESILDGNIVDAENEETQQAFDLVFNMQDALEDEVLSQSDVVQNMKSSLEAFARGEIDEDTITQLLGRQENKDLNNNANARDIAKQRVQERASKLLDIYNNVLEYKKVLQESKIYDKLSENVKRQLIFNRVLDQDIDAKLEELEKEINGNSSVSTSNTNTSFYSEQGRKAKLVEADKEIEDLEKELKEQRKEIKKLRKKWNLNPMEELTLKNSNFLIESLKERINLAKENKKQLNETANTDRVLSKEEILRLNPTERAEMLNAQNLKMFSKEQQQVIKKLIRDLNIKNPNLLRQIQDSGTLYRRKDANLKAYDKILNNQEIFNDYASYMEYAFQSRAINVVNNIIQEDVFKLLDSTLEQDLKATIFNEGIGHRVLQQYIDARPERADKLQSIQEVVKLQSIANSIINSINPNKAETAGLKNEVYQITKDSNNVEEAMRDLEKLIDSTEDPAKIAILENLLNRLANLKYQRNTQVIQDRKERQKQLAEENKKLEEIEQKHLEQPEAIPSEGTQTTSENTLQQAGEAEDVELESPSIETQGKQLGVPIQEVTQDVTDEGNSLEESLDFIGNVYPGYENDPLINEGKLIPKKGTSEKDRMNILYDFLKNKGIKLQDIIDYELSSIIKNDPKVKIHFMMYKLNDNNFNNYIFNVIEYTDEVKKIHKEDRGGVITSNGKQYLIVGVTGTNFAKGKQYKDLFFTLKDRLVRKKLNFFNTNPEELYYVSDDYTQVKEIQSGRRVKQLEGDESAEFRSLSELLYDESGNYNEERNPRHIGNPKNKKQGYAGLSWIIQKGTSYVVVNQGSKQVIPLIHPENNNGAVFLLVESPNGKYIPMYVEPAFYNEIAEGELKKRINSLLLELTSKDFERRKKAKDQLRQFLVLTDNDTITLGKEGFNVISIKRNGTVYKTFNLDDNLNIEEFLKAIEESGFRINVTQSVLSNPTLVTEYDAAGALKLNIASLSTRNASYTLYNVGSDGKPIINDTPSYPSKPNNTSSNSNNRYIRYGNKQYKLEDGIYSDSLGNRVTDNELIKKLTYLQQLVGKIPDYQEGGFDYYIVDNTANNPTIIKIGRTNEVSIISNEQAMSLLETINRAKEAEAKAEVTKKALDELPSIDLGSEGTYTGEVDVAAQMTGDFTPQSAEPKENSKEVVTKPQTKNTKDINEAGKNSFENLQDSNSFTTFAKVYKSPKYRSLLKKLFTAKGWNWSTKESDIEKVLKDNNIPITGITNIDTWLDIIKNCR